MLVDLKFRKKKLVHFTHLGSASYQIDRNGQTRNNVSLGQ